MILVYLKLLVFKNRNLFFNSASFALLSQTASESPFLISLLFYPMEGRLVCLIQIVSFPHFCYHVLFFVYRYDILLVINDC